MSDVLTIVVTYNSDDVIEDCLGSARESGLDRVVVWDNGSIDLTGELVTKSLLPGLSLVNSGRNLGFGSAVNRAVSGADPSKYLLFLNPDCRITRRTLLSLVTRLDDDNRLGAVVPRMMYPDGSAGFAGGPWPSLLKECIAATHLDHLVTRRWQQSLMTAAVRFRVFPSLTGYLRVRDAAGLAACDWVSGFCLLVRRDAWMAVSGFDERYFLYFEDVDLCRRIRAADYEVACDNDVAAVHLESTSTGRHSKSRHYRRGFLTYLKIHGNAFERPLARLAAKWDQ